jgi:hypothetical protein
MPVLMEVCTVLRMGTQALLSFQDSTGAFRGGLQLSPPLTTLLRPLGKRNLGADLDAEVTSFLCVIGITKDSPVFDEHQGQYVRLAKAAYAGRSRRLVRVLSRSAAQFADPILFTVAKVMEPELQGPSPEIRMETWDTAFALRACIKLGLKDESERALRWLLRIQRADGGWSVSPKYKLADSDTTAFVVSALSSYLRRNRVRCAIDRALVWLEGCRLDDGSFRAFQHAHGLPCPEVTAAVAVAFKSCDRELPARTRMYLERTKSMSALLYRDLGHLCGLLRDLGLDVPVTAFNTFEGTIEGAGGGEVRESLVRGQQEDGTWPPGAYIRFVGNTFLLDEVWTNALAVEYLAENT